VPAPRLAKIRSRDPQPLVLGRRIEHPPQELTIARLELLALVEGAASRGDPLRQGIANPLQLLQPRDPWDAPPTRNLGFDFEPWKRLRAQSRELVLEAADLTAQLRARRPLVASNPKRNKRLVCKHIRHEPSRV
jgi:hypothetical protein